MKADIMLWALTGTNTEWLSGPMTLSNQLEMIANFENRSAIVG